MESLYLLAYPAGPAGPPRITITAADYPIHGGPPLRWILAALLSR